MFSTYWQFIHSSISLSLFFSELCIRSPVLLSLKRQAYIPCFHRFAITGKALGWIQSYLSGRTQFVKIGTERSSSRNLFCGVPQSSVLGPILYSMYTSLLIDIISKHNMNHHFYADDSQIYLSFKPSAAGEPTRSKLRIESCIHDFNNWMSANKLMLNHDKMCSLFCTPVIDPNSH